jgi:hypothetical protein
MSTSNNSPLWQQIFLDCMARDTLKQEQTFLALLDNLFDGQCDLDTARVLMKSFSDKPDHGTQERVISVLMQASPEVRIRAIFEELPRLNSEAPEWASSLLGQELDHHPSTVVDIVKNSPSQTIEAVSKVLADADFVDFYPASSILAKTISKV